MLRHAIATALIALPLTAGAATPPGNGTLAFEVDRDGKAIGTHALTFSRSADAIDIRIKTEIAVKVAFITAYRFEHTGHEVWRGGKLASIESKTNDDGTKHDLRVARDGDALNVQADGKSFKLPGDLYTGSLWNKDLVTAPVLVNTLDGSEMKIQVRDLGPEMIDAAGRKVRATHFSVTGDLNRELWYDDGDHLVQLKLKGKDGSEVQYRLVRCDFC